MAKQEPQDNAKNSQQNGGQNNATPTSKPGLGDNPTSVSGQANGSAVTNGGSSNSRSNAVAAVKDALANDEVESVIIRGEAEAVKLDNIEKGLTRLWQAAGKPRAGEGGSPVMRACVLNLVIFADSGAHLGPVTEVITKLTWSYPCRALVLVSEPQETGDDMKAFISAHCQQPNSSGNKVCCEQITIHGVGAASDRLTSMVLPLLVPDLPVVVWWPGDPPMQGHTFERLLDNADRFISDSSQFTDFVGGLSHMAELVDAENYRHIVISDFNWARLTTWRRLIAQFFDEPHLLPYLFNVDKIEIEFVAPDDGKQPNVAMGLLLVGWLACKLNWQPAFGLKQRGKNSSLILNQNGQPLNIEFNGHTQPHNVSGGITSVKITSVIENQEAIFAVSLDENTGLAYTMTEENNMPHTRQVMLPMRDSAELLIEELQEVNRDATYEQILIMVANILGNTKVRKTDATPSSSQ